VKRSNRAQGLRTACFGLVALVVLGATAAGAAGDPDFGAVRWAALDCAPGGDPAGDESPSSADLVGDPSHPATYYAYDAKYLYFRYRLDSDPTSKGGFVENIWSALMQVPSGNPKQYQYEIAVNGKSDSLELWANTSAKDLSFSPNFNDGAEVRVFAQGVNAANGSTVNATPLVRAVPTGDGSAFGGTPDYFLDFAMPINVLVANGVIADAGDLASSLFAPATSSNVNSFNKDHFDCGFLGGAAFLPSGTLSIDATLTPESAAVNVTTPVVYSITVHNDGPAPAKAVAIEGAALPGYMGDPSLAVSSDDAIVESVNPLKVSVPLMPAGSTVTIELSADAQPGCGDDGFTESITASATNAPPVTYSGTFGVDRAVRETCDGVDNDCDGHVDGDGLCDDGNACTTDTCHGEGGCSHETIPGCQRPCTTAGDCDDHDPCTGDSCSAGVCAHMVIADCRPPVKPVEICGDCIDNDGDGLVDWEDPDCCEQLLALTPKRVMLKRPAAKGRNRMRVKAIYSQSTPAGFDPTRDDTSVQIADGTGQVVCATVPAGHWMRPTPRRFSFCDKDGAFAGGLRDGRFVKRRNGRVVFRAISRKLPDRAVEGTNVRITVRVGNQCSQSTMELRAKKTALVYP